MCDLKSFLEIFYVYPGIFKYGCFYWVKSKYIIYKVPSLPRESSWVVLATSIFVWLTLGVIRRSAGLILPGKQKHSTLSTI